MPYGIRLGLGFVSGQGGSYINIFDGVAPVIASSSFDDDTDNWAVTTDTPNKGIWVWGRFADTTTGVTADGSGGFSGATAQETGILSVGASGAELDIPETGTTGTAYELFMYQWDGVTASNIITIGYTADNTAPTVTGVLLSTTSIELTFSESVIGLSASDWGVKIGGVSQTIDSLTHTDGTSSAQLRITGDTFAAGDAITMSYSGTSVEDAAENKMATFTDQSVTNTLSSLTLATDPDALWYFRPSGVSFDGSNNVTSWVDDASGATGVWDLDTIPSTASAPTWNASESRVEGTGSQQICNNTAGDIFGRPIVVDASTGFQTVFIVAEALSAKAQGPFLGWSRDSGTNQRAGVGYSSAGAVGTDADMGVFYWSNRFGAAGFGSQFQGVATTNTTPIGKYIFEVQMDGPNLEARYYLNGVLERTEAIVTGNMSQDANCYLALFGTAGPTWANTTQAGYIYSAFATENTDDLITLRSELASNHGIAL